VKEFSTVRAIHVNSGTSFDREELTQNKRQDREFWPPSLTVPVEEGDSTAYGGLSLATVLSSALRIPQRIDEKLSSLRIHLLFWGVRSCFDSRFQRVYRGRVVHFNRS
jgi:hypothetical protein